MAGLAVRQLKTVYKLKEVQVTHTQLDPGQEIPWHRHTSVADTFYVIRGPVIIEAGDGEIALLTGQSAQIAAGESHRVSNRCGEMVEFLLIQGVGEYDFHEV